VKEVKEGMNSRRVPISEDELHAFVDGELPADRRADVEAWLAGHPEDAARVSAWRTQAELIQRRYGGIAGEPVAPRFEIDRLTRATRPRWRLAVAAACLALLVGGAAGWFGRGAWEGVPAVRAVAAEAIEAHKLYVVEVRHPVEVPADASHLMAWLSKRVGHELRAPDLLELGLRLIGGRLLPGAKGAAAFFMYEGGSGERFTLYCARATAPDTALRYRVSGQVAAFYWIEGEFGYVMTGPADRDRLQKVVERAYEQLEKSPPAKSSSSRG
jgi:anti-sigma factor RsiW